MTLNQIVAKINELALNHKQIKSVYFGDLADYMSRGVDNIYPSLYYDVTGSNITERAININFSLYLFDWMLPEETNETEVLSDMLEVCQDIIAQLGHPNWEFDISPAVQISYFTENTPDLLAGVRADISLELPFLADRCQVPSTFNFSSI